MELLYINVYKLIISDLILGHEPSEGIDVTPRTEIRGELVYDLFFLLTILTGKGFLGSAWSNTYFVRYYITGLVQSKLAHTIYTQRFLLEVSFSKDNEVFEVSNFFAINLEKNGFHFFSWDGVITFTSMFWFTLW